MQVRARSSPLRNDVLGLRGRSLGRSTEHDQYCISTRRSGAHWQAMTATTATASTTTAPPAAAISAPSRIASIDIFRGLTMLVMIFVNDLGEVRGLPWWTYHAHAQQDLMTYVDMVFPFFLF